MSYCTWNEACYSISKELWLMYDRVCHDRASHSEGDGGEGGSCPVPELGKWTTNTPLETMWALDRLQEVQDTTRLLTNSVKITMFIGEGPIHAWACSWSRLQPRAGKPGQKNLLVHLPGQNLPSAEQQRESAGGAHKGLKKTADTGSCADWLLHFAKPRYSPVALSLPVGDQRDL